MLGYGLAGTVIVVLLIVFVVRALWTQSSGRVRNASRPFPWIPESTARDGWCSKPSTS